MEQPDRVAAVILAAGESRRFGSPKQLAMLDGRPLLWHVIDTARGAGLSLIIAVIPPDLPFHEADILPVPNPQPELGMSHSLRLGFAALPDDIEAAIILLGDQPTADPPLLGRLIAARGATPFVSARVNGLLAPPVVIERSQFAAVREPIGDIGLRDILRKNGDRVTAVDVPAPLPDIDTQADLANLGGGD